MKLYQKLIPMFILALILQLISPGIFNDKVEIIAASNGPLVSTINVTYEKPYNTQIVPTIDLYFDEAIQKNDTTKKVTLRKETTGAVIDKEMLISDSNITIVNNNVLRIRMSTAIDFSTNYLVTVEAGAVKNNQNQPLAANYIGQFTSITNDFASPQISKLEYVSCPVDAATGNFGTTCATITNAGGTTANINTVNTTFKLTFNEAIRLGTGNITVQATDNSYIETIDVSSGRVLGSGNNSVTFTLSKPLLANKTYYLIIAASNFKDEAQNSLANQATFYFSTTADEAITMTSTPSKGAVDVILNNGRVSLSLAFNINVSPIVGKYIYIYNTLTSQEVERILVTSGVQSGKTFTYTSNNLLNENTDYYIRIDKGSYVSGQNLYRGIDAANEWLFKTKASNDTQRPYLTSTTPVNNATNVPRNELIILRFNEPVYALSGAVQIKEVGSNVVYRSIDVTSQRVTGSGTSTITIDPHKALTGIGEGSKTYDQNKSYYVQIPESSFKDSSNNTSVINTFNNFTFTVGEQATSKPLLTNLKPLNGTETVTAGTGQTFILEFDRDVTVNTAASNAQVFLKNGTQPIAMTATQPSGKPKQIELTPNTALASNTEYYINVPNNLIQDTNGNNYDGILNTYQWTFRTLGSDTIAPKIVRAESNGNKIRIVFDELLKENVVPSIGYFFVTINGVTKNISSISIEKNAAVLTMYEQINANQPVLVSYTKPTVNPIQDLTGNAAVSFSNQDVVYGTLTTVPSIVSSSYSGRNITLEFNEPLQKINSLAYLQFSVQANGTNNAVTSISQSGTKITLGVTTSISSNRTVVVNYNKGAYPLQGYSNDVNNFSLTVGQQGSVNTTTAPTVTSITANGTSVVITYNQSVSIAPSTGQYSVSANGLAKSITNVQLSGQTVTLTLSTAVQNTETVQVSYTTTGKTLLSNTATGLYAASYQNLLATVGATSGKIALQSGILKGDQITLGFTKPIDTNYIPKSSQFYVMIDGNNWEIKQVTVQGSNMTLKLPRSVTVGVAATLSYFTTEDTLRATDGERVSTISSFKLANQTTLIDILPNEYAALTNGVLLKEATATKSTAKSPSGKSVTQYTVSNTSIQTVIDAVKSTGTSSIEIRFEVPTTEAAAVVVFPMSALQSASRTGKFIFSVKYGDVYYQVPTDSVDITNAVALNKGSAYTNNLVLKMETGSNSSTALLESSIKSSGSTLVSGPFLFEATIDGPTGSSQVPLKGNLVRKVVIPKLLTKEQTGAVFYDTVAGNISGMPTTFNVSGTNTEVTFMRPGTSAYAIVSSNKTFTDTKGHWAEYSILTLSRKSIIEGHSATKFNPQVNITRGEFATYLVKGLGLSADKDAAKQFTDVNVNSALGGYIGAAYKAGIVSGVSSTQFKPNAYITREDMAIMMMRLVTYTKMDISLTNTPNNYISQFTDGNKVSSYARTQVGQAIQIGVITGSTPTTISPLSNATRAEGITMIDRVLRKANYLQ